MAYYEDTTHEDKMHEDKMHEDKTHGHKDFRMGQGGTMNWHRRGADWRREKEQH